MGVIGRSLQNLIFINREVVALSSFKGELASALAQNFTRYGVLEIAMPQTAMHLIDEFLNRPIQQMVIALLQMLNMNPVRIPTVITAMGDFPHVHGSDKAQMLGKQSALAFKSLIVAAFGEESLSVEGCSIRNQYLELLRPYIPEDNSQNKGRNDRPRNGDCQECTEYFDVLKVAADAPEAEIKASYRDLAQIYHPDRFTGNERFRKKAESQMTKLNVAYSLATIFSRTL